MLFFQNFQNYEEFESLFPMVKHGNGVVSRKNKILLACLKDKTFFHVWREMREIYRESQKPLPIDFFRIKSMDELKTFLKEAFKFARYKENYKAGPLCCLSLMADEWCLYSRTYYLDHFHGVCADGDTTAIRYVNNGNDRVFKMKAGKFLCKCLEEFEFTSSLPEQAKRWISEEFAREWQTYAESGKDRFTLHTGGHNSDFAFIYGSDGFGSCMSRQDQYEFYTYAVDATAAWLEDEDGNLVARCVIFNRVTDEDGKTWRLAERQYALDEDDVLKQILVDKLLKEGYIDGYKRVGVDCHDNRNFVSKDGESLRHKEFRIDCSLHDNDTLSYQDSFVFYDHYKEIAYNYKPGKYTERLDETYSTFEEDHSDDVWSEYEDCYIPEDEAVYDDYNEDYIYSSDAETAIYHGRTIYLNKNRSDYFSWSNRHEAYIHNGEAEYVERYDDYFLAEETVCDCNGETQLMDDCLWSPTFGDYILKETAVYSEVLGDYFPSIEERDKAELADSETA